MDIKSLALKELAKNQAGNFKSSPAVPTEQERIQDAAKQFESMLAQQMTKSMWSTVPKGEMTGSFEEGFYRDMLSEAMANELSNGRGLGIKEVVAKEMGFKKAEKKGE